MEAEHIACYEATRHVIWLRNSFSNLHVVDSIVRPLRIFCDNNVAIQSSKNNKTIGESKHVDIKYLAIRERVQNRVVSIEHIINTLMWANPLTKALPPKLFMEFVTRMGLVASLSI